MRAWLILIAGCGQVVPALPEPPSLPAPAPTDPCFTADHFDQCFADAWCEAWSACGFPESCADTEPWTTHYESNDGTMSLDCQAVEPDYAGCLALPPAASCDELRDAAQLDTTNGPWIGVCITSSCV